ADKFPEWSLVIVGEGPSRKELELHITGFGLAGRILLPGWVEQPWRNLTMADVFVLPSRYEGFPNALLEAMARGKACVAVHCPSGPAEIVRSGDNGLLVDGLDDEETEAAIGVALDSLLGSEGLRESLCQNAKGVLEEFSVERHFAAWDAIEV
nr:glycosyltransferase [Planctomycetota bacterium]